MPSSVLVACMWHNRFFWITYRSALRRKAGLSLEAGHKEFWKIRLCNNRKTSRTDANTDIIKTLLLTSDPQLSSYRQSLNNKNKNNLFDNEIRQYLVIKESHDSDSLLDIPEDVINAIDSDTEDDNWLNFEWMFIL